MGDTADWGTSLRETHASSRRQLQSSVQRLAEQDRTAREALQHWVFTHRLRDLFLITHLSLNAVSLVCNNLALKGSWQRRKCFRECFYAPIPTLSPASCTLLLAFKYLGFFW